MDLKKKVAIAAAVAVPALGLGAPAAAAAKTTLIGSGSSAELPVLTALFAGYKKADHNKVNFIYTADGGNAGVKDVQEGHSQFAVNTRAPLPSDSGTTQYKLYLDGLCVDVNKANHLTNLTLKQTANIFLAIDTSWSQVPPAGLSSTIDPIGRNSTAGSYRRRCWTARRSQAAWRSSVRTAWWPTRSSTTATRSDTSGWPIPAVRAESRSSRSTAGPAMRPTSGSTRGTR